jgi:hypothetical protein
MTLLAQHTHHSTHNMETNTKQTTTTTTELKDDKARAAMLGVMKEISEQMSKIDVAREQVNEILDAAAKAFQIPKPMLRKVSKLYHKQGINEFETEVADVKNIYKQITTK